MECEHSFGPFFSIGGGSTLTFCRSYTNCDNLRSTPWTTDYGADAAQHIARGERIAALKTDMAGAPCPGCSGPATTTVTTHSAQVLKQPTPARPSQRPEIS
eukprot:scaffold17175_cov111-Isochrysis_galbana.AAC.1